MRIIIACVLLSCLAAITSAADEHRPVKKKDDRGKRNLEYQVSHHYSGPLSYRLERRISTGPQHPLYPPSQFYPGPPRPYSSYRKDSHNDLGRDDLLTDNNHIQENIHRESHVYGPHKPHIIERPVYIKEPEPIIEIIIKESNVSLPAPPPTPPPKKKKEQVQVFYVKYKKNPHGVGKDSVIYDKPIPAISPKLPDDDEDEEEEEAPYSYHRESATAPPPPTTTLRTIIKPDSEVYHSPSGVKVTFGKEGFDYDKRSSKPEEYNPPQRSPAPQGRQLTSFSNTYFKRPTTNQNFQPPPSNYRAPQPYRPFSFPPPPPSSYKPFGRQSPPQFPPQPKYPFQSPPYTKPTSQQYTSFPSSRPQSQPPQFSHTVSHPAPAHFQNSRPPPPQTRQPVPYQPFDNLRPQQPFPQPPQQPAPHINPNPQPQIQFRPETHFPTHQQLPLTQQPQSFNPTRYSQPSPQPNIQQQFRQEEPPQARPQRVQSLQQPQHGHQLQQVQQPQQPPPTHYQHQINHNDFRNQQVQSLQQNQQQQQQQEQISQNEHFNNIQAAQGILPPGGQLIQSVPKYEQHVSEVQSVDGHKTEQRLSAQEFQQKIFQQFNLNQNAGQNNQHPQQELLQQQQFDQQRQQQRQQEQEELRTAQQYYRQDQGEQQRNLQQDFSYTTPRSGYQSTKRTSQYISSTPRITYQSTTTRPTTTTTQEPETPSTTTKDPKILEAQLPDEVPEELRAQLLSSGILNNADISILDYDKVGDIPLSALPPDQLANFYNAGGGAQLAAAGSAPVPSILQTDGSEVEDRITETEEDQEPEGSEIEEVRAASPPGVEMKVVRYDPDTEKGQKVQEAYVKDGAQQVDPVVLNDNTYNRYLPLKVNGTQFPIPDVPELKGKKISSVVVLAPVTYDFSSGRKTRDTSKQPNDIDLIQGDDLKQLLTNPSSENYKKFLESENKTRSDKQAVILLVTDPQDSSSKEKEIYMYDVATQTVSKLSGELSSAFVEAAEANSEDNPEDSPSNIVETRVPFAENVDRQDFHPLDADLDDSASDLFESKVPITDPLQGEDMETEASEQVQSIVDISGRPIILEDLAVSGNELNSLESQVFINSGYSKTGHS